jgi:hypothetical protein
MRRSIKPHRRGSPRRPCSGPAWGRYMRRLVEGARLPPGCSCAASLTGAGRHPYSGAMIRGPYRQRPVDPAIHAMENRDRAWARKARLYGYAPPDDSNKSHPALAY